MSITSKIALYKFQDSIEIAKVTIVGNLFLAFAFIGSGVGTNISFRLTICLVTAIIYYAIYKMYSWKSPIINILLIALYMGIVFAEIEALGIPKGAAYLQDYSAMSKGVMLDLFVAGGPHMYIALKFFLVLPLIPILLRSRSLN